MKKIISVFLVLTIVFSCAVPAGAVGTWNTLSETFSDTLSAVRDVANRAATRGQGDTWAIYLYLCGSDLESRYGCASADISEIMQVKLPANVKVVIETGGSVAWAWSHASANKLGRYVYESTGMYFIENVPQASMGSADTFADFLSFCTKNYPADREMVILWNHGGGVCGGVCYDQNYSMDCLTIPELKKALSKVLKPNAKNPPLEFIGFDTCLTSSIDMAYAMSEYAHYMIASEQTEPGCGWAYNRFLGALASNPKMDSVTFGKAVVDGYFKECIAVGCGDKITMSVLDLTNLDPLMKAYENFGKEAQSKGKQQGETFYSALSRAARQSENYGSNSASAGYHNMVDLGDFMRNAKDLLPKSANAVVKAISGFVVYNRVGTYHPKSQGIACFFPYSGSTRDLSSYQLGAAGKSVPAFYHQMLTGEYTSSDAEEFDFSDYLSGLGGSLAQVLENMPFYVDSDMNLHVTIPKKLLRLLSSVYIRVYAVDRTNDTYLCLGRTHSLTGDWDTGEFTIGLSDKWGTLNGHVCFMEPMFESKEYNTYHIPILLNKVPHQLVVNYDFSTKSYTISGAVEGLDTRGNTMASKTMVQLKPGDTVTTLFYTRGYHDLTDTNRRELETFVLGKDINFKDMSLPNGYYYVPLEMVDFLNRSITVGSIMLELKNGHFSVVEHSFDFFK